MMVLIIVLIVDKTKYNPSGCILDRVATVRSVG
jgi:hypothetical protein